jgi:hypothetical protein
MFILSTSLLAPLSEGDPGVYNPDKIPAQWAHINEGNQTTASMESSVKGQRQKARLECIVMRRLPSTDHQGI